MQNSVKSLNIPQMKIFKQWLIVTIIIINVTAVSYIFIKSSEIKYKTMRESKERDTNKCYCYSQWLRNRKGYGTLRRIRSQNSII